MSILAASAGDQAASQTNYSTRLNAQLEVLFLNVLKRRAPMVAQWISLTFRPDIPNGEQASPYLQALTIKFQLARIVNEIDLVRSARLQEKNAGRDAITGSFAKAFKTAKANNETIASITKNLSIGPTITAHPTEAKRVTVLEIHRRIYRTLTKLETDRWTPRERTEILNDIEGEIELLWLTGELRLNRPTLSEEIDWGLQFFQDSIFNAIPQVFDSYETAMNDAGISADCDPNPCIKFHSWIGGDRDGNPNVTVAETRTALEKGRALALSLYKSRLDEIAARLSVSNFLIELTEDHVSKLQAIIDDHVLEQNPNEIFRQAASAIKSRLENDDYKYVGDFITHLDQLDQALCSIKAENLARRYIRKLRRQASVFGFRTVTLDIRQNSDVTTSALSSIWAGQSLGDLEYGTAEWSTRLRHDLSSSELSYVDKSKVSPEAAEILELLAMMHEVHTGPDPDAIGPFILSMTRSTDDILGVYLLARYAGLGSEIINLSVVPLFETIEDLRNAPEILIDLLSVPLARRSIKSCGDEVEIMLGYSDSNKDGGFLCSVWELDQAQRKIDRTLANFGMKAAFFHGRGGSVSRGGAPTGRAIAAQPAGTISGRLRITEQGEVVSEHYANRGTAARRLEQLAAATLAHSLQPVVTLQKPEYDDALSALSGTSQAAYAMLLNTQGFVTYFQQASPVEELARLKIGSRPARRAGLAGLEDLRAIPWVFAWSQNRHLITGWYGFGTAIQNFRKFRKSEGENLLQEMFADYHLFQMVVDEVEKSLCQTDLEIGALYAGLVEDQDIRTSVFDKIKTEFMLTCEGIQFLTSSSHIGNRFPKFQKRFSQVQNDLRHLNHLQVGLLRTARRQDTVNGNSVALLQSMNSISTGLGWTG